MEQKRVEASLPISKEQIQQNEVLSAFYDEEKGLIVFDMNEHLTDEFVENLQQLISDEKINTRELVEISPLVAAVNELQFLKLLEYQPELDEESLKEAGEKYKVNFIYDEDDIFSLDYEFLDGGNPDDADKVDKLVEKFIKDAHNESYQDYKDAKKVLGSFNTSRKIAKKEMKAPAQAYLDKINSLDKLMEGEYKSTYEAIDSNFKDALDYEAELKAQKEAAKNAELLKQTEEVSEKNKELTEKLENQSKEVELAQTFNSIKYTAIGGVHGHILKEKGNWNVDYLTELLEEKKKLSFQDLLNESSIDVEKYNELSDEQKIELSQEFEAAKVLWIKALTDEIEARKNKEVVRSFEDNGKLPDFASKSEPVTEMSLLEKWKNFKGNDDEKFLLFLETFDVHLNMFIELEQAFDALAFDEVPYAKKKTQILTQLFPKIEDMLKQTRSFARDHYEKYTEYKKENS